MMVCYSGQKHYANCWPLFPAKAGLPMVRIWWRTDDPAGHPYQSSTATIFVSQEPVACFCVFFTGTQAFVPAKCLDNRNGGSQSPATVLWPQGTVALQDGLLQGIKALCKLWTTISSLGWSAYGGKPQRSQRNLVFYGLFYQCNQCNLWFSSLSFSCCYVKCNKRKNAMAYFPHSAQFAYRVYVSTQYKSYAHQDSA